MARSKKKEIANHTPKRKELEAPKKPKKKKKTQRDPGASQRFKEITQRAKEIREKHPKMKWKNCIKQASKERYKTIKTK